MSQLCQGFVEVLRESDMVIGVSIADNNESTQVSLAPCIREGLVTWWIVQRAGLYPCQNRVFFASWEEAKHTNLAGLFTINWDVVIFGVSFSGFVPPI